MITCSILKPKSFATQVTPATETDEPMSASSALHCPTWKRTMQTEYEALVNNATWSLVSPNPSQKLVENKWVFKIKRLPDGTIE